jgi:hypothetical protein
MSTTPVTFAVDYTAERSRLTTFFRLLLAIPHLIVLFFYGIGAFVAVVIAWFALVFTGRWPAGLYGFAAGFFRYNARLNGYLYLLCDPYPPFDGGEHPEYPARLSIGPPKEEYSRMKVLLRIFLLIPVWIIGYILTIVARVLAVLAWLVIVVIGRQPEGLQDAMRFAVSYLTRAAAYAGLMFEEWPAFSDAPPAGGLRPE